MTCKECLYFKRCVVLGVELDMKHNKEADKNCRHFKNKDNFVELQNQEELLVVLKNELECIKRQNGGMCSNARDCENCDLRLHSSVVVNVYEQIINALTKQAEGK